MVSLAFFATYDDIFGVRLAPWHLQEPKFQFWVPDTSLEKTSSSVFTTVSTYFSYNYLTLHLLSTYYYYYVSGSHDKSYLTNDLSIIAFFVLQMVNNLVW